MRNNSKSVAERFVGIIKRNILVSATIIFAVILLIVSFALIEITKIKDERDARKAYEALSEEEKMLYEQDFSLAKDAYEDVNAVINEYFTALSNGDVDYISEVSQSASVNNLDNIVVKSDLIESYSNITCYTQAGYAENSYYVYVTYYFKTYDFDELIPGVIGIYLIKNDDGSFTIVRRDEISDEVKKNFYVAFMSQDVQDIYNQVILEYSQILDNNEKLKAFMATGFNEKQTDGLVEVNVERLAEEKALKEQQTEVETPKIEIVKANTSVNVRTSDSGTAERLGTVSEGTELTRLENRLNGWSKVVYEGKEAFIKSEYLDVIGIKEDDGTVVAVTEKNGDNNTSTGNTQKTDTEIKYVTAVDNVNIRAEADIDSDRVGFAYNGEKLEFVEKMSNGWTKVKYNNKECFVKSDYVQ